METNHAEERDQTKDGLLGHQQQHFWHKGDNSHQADHPHTDARCRQLHDVGTGHWLDLKNEWRKIRRDT